MTADELNERAAAVAADLARLKPHDAPSRAEATATLMLRGLHRGDAEAVVAHSLVSGWVCEVAVLGKAVLIPGRRGREPRGG
jgi:hypothetical protein